ncbi:MULTISPECIES: VOC family protein [Bacillus]|uniref:VOC family protein n=1 Tax=Bacillus TaxID=1386 RepID=UPI000BB82156|nr:MULTISPECIES: VOC family protein [Bacillus]
MWVMILIIIIGISTIIALLREQLKQNKRIIELLEEEKNNNSELEKVYERVKMTGCPIDERIETQPWGERCFYAKDPFGNPICFVDESTVFLGQEKE